MKKVCYNIIIFVLLLITACGLADDETTIENVKEKMLAADFVQFDSNYRYNGDGFYLLFTFYDDNSANNSVGFYDISSEISVTYFYNYNLIGTSTCKYNADSLTPQETSGECSASDISNISSMPKLVDKVLELADLTLSDLIQATNE